jgi:replicative DNA helicase
MKNNNGIGLIPPQDTELEKAILGTLLIESNSITEIVDILKEDCFYSEKHKLIYRSIIDLYKENEPVDLLTVTNRLRKNGDLENCGGAFFITELTSMISSSNNLEFHSRILIEKSIKRDLIRISSEVQKESYNDESDALDVVGKMENFLTSLSNDISVGKTYKVSQIFKENIERIERASKKTDGVTGIKTGYSEIDRLTSGWQGSDLIIVAARPAMGKTDLAINFAREAAVQGIKTAIFSLEMSKEQLFDRFLAVDLEIDRQKIKTGKLEDHDWMKVTQAKKSTQESFIIQDEPGLNVLQFRALCRRLKTKEKIGLVIVDYLQLMSTNIQGNTNDKVSDISRNLKLVAKELNIPVIALSQLSRAVETRGGDKRPMLSDLRDSGAIEQDADIIIFPYRPIYYGIQETENCNDTRQLMELDFAKNRSGAVDNIMTRYLGKYGKIIDWKESYTENSIQKLNVNETYRPDKFNSSGANEFESIAAPF